MPDWTAPFHMPQYTDDEFEVQKAKHVAEHGYTITVPGLSDIFHFGTPDPMTFAEEEAWKAKAWDAFPPDRLHELQKMKKKKYDRYQAMLKSPTPDIVRNAGSIMTALDDAQDCISTMAMIGRIAVRFAPRLLARAFLGPIGWLLLANDILNLIITLGQMVTLPTSVKRVKDSCTRSSPFSKKGKALRARKLLTAMPTKGDIIQALQTTDQIFGFGISLGPLVGLAQDVIAGTVRTILGQKVSINIPVPDRPRFLDPAAAVLKSGSYALAHPHGTDEMMILELLLANYFANQVMMPYQQEWNSLDVVEDIGNCEVLIPYPKNILTLEVISELDGPDPLNAIWPGIGRPWGNLTRISDIGHPVATDNLTRFVKRNEHNWLGYSGGVLACEAATYSIANLEGEEDIKYDYDAKSKIAGNLLEAGYYPDPEQPRDRLNNFVNFLDASERLGLPTHRDFVIAYCRDNNIKLLPIKSAL